VRVRVPASSANLGPGYDSFALALSLYDDVVAQVSDTPGVRVDVHGEGADTVPRTAKHLVARAMLAAFDQIGGRPRGLDLVCANRIPHGRGLGSSAAAIVSGITLARALVIGGEDRLGQAASLALATDLEGHPDNVAAALAGGLTVSWRERSEPLGRSPETSVGEARSVRLSVVDSVVPVVCVPSTQVSTQKARRLLPQQVPHADAGANLARAALLVAALTGPADRTDLLMTATQDWLHQPHRRPAYPRSADLVVKLRAAGIPATISGAGPTVLALADAASAGRVEGLAGARFATQVLAVDQDGAAVVPLTE
jgi:homoserine kinase